jgi:hypothetical protein
VRQLLADRQRVAHGVRDEQRRHGHVDGGAVEVERIPRRHNDSHSGGLYAGVLHLGDQPRQRGFDDDVATINRYSRAR